MKLAIKGGEKYRKTLFPYQTSIGTEEAVAAQRVMESKLLSSYRGNFGKQFGGGDEIQALEQEWADKHKVKHAIACNSCTSGLHIACGAIGLKPDDEVIVTPWSMTCSATAPMVWGAKPVFADICDEFFSLDPWDVEKRITDRTKAIIVVSLFGSPYNQEINQIAKEYGLLVIEDAAQAVGATYKGKLTGSLGDMGVFSFTQGKHMTAGEGGIITTNDDELAMRCRLIMNHAEAVVNDMAFQKYDYDLYKNLYGFNMRLTNMQAAIIREQLKKWKLIVDDRKVNSNYLRDEISKIPGIRPADLPEDYSPSYYVMPFYYDEKVIGVPRKRFVEAFAAEMMPERGREKEGTSNIIVNGYITPIYRMPLFEEKYRNHFMYDNDEAERLAMGGQVNAALIKEFPNVERMQRDEVFLLQAVAHPLTIEGEIKDVVGAMWKVFENREELK